MYEVWGRGHAAQNHYVASWVSTLPAAPISITVAIASSAASASATRNPWEVSDARTAILGGASSELGDSGQISTDGPVE